MATLYHLQLWQITHLRLTYDNGADKDERVFGRWVSVGLSPEALLALAMGLHARLGARSWVRELVEDVLRVIVRCAGSFAL